MSAHFVINEALVDQTGIFAPNDIFGVLTDKHSTIISCVEKKWIIIGERLMGVKEAK